MILIIQDGKALLQRGAQDAQTHVGRFLKEGVLGLTERFAESGAGSSDFSKRIEPAHNGLVAFLSAALSNIRSKYSFLIGLVM
jgi:hypothetical protein